MERYEEILALLEIEEDEDEQKMIHDWIRKVGVEKVYQECLKIYQDEKKK